MIVHDQTWQPMLFLDVWMGFLLAHAIIFSYYKKTDGEKVLSNWGTLTKKLDNLQSNDGGSHSQQKNGFRNFSSGCGQVCKTI